MQIKCSITFLFVLNFLVASCTESRQPTDRAAQVLTEAEKKELEKATFAGGCFWCVEAVFERVKGVKQVVSGYAGGSEKNPTYDAVSAGKTSHAEAVQLFYDPSVVSYQTLLEIFFATHDPTTLNRQGPDVGAQYRSAVFYHNEEQEKAVREYVKKLEREGKFRDPVVTELVPYEKFYEAENYHQDYYALNPDNSYVRAVSRPKVKKFEKEFRDYLKEAYK